MRHGGLRAAPGPHARCPVLAAPPASLPPVPERQLRRWTLFGRSWDTGAAGEIPAELGQLTKLQHLALCNNRLLGA